MNSLRSVIQVNQSLLGGEALPFLGRRWSYYSYYLSYHQANGWSVVYLNIFERFLRWLGLSYYQSTHFQTIRERLSLEKDVPAGLIHKIQAVWNKTHPGSVFSFQELIQLSLEEDVKKSGFLKNGEWNLTEISSQIQKDVLRMPLLLNETRYTEEQKLIEAFDLSELFAKNEKIKDTGLTNIQRKKLQALCLLQQGSLFILCAFFRKKFAPFRKEPYDTKGERKIEVQYDFNTHKMTAKLSWKLCLIDESLVLSNESIPLSSTAQIQDDGSAIISWTFD